MKTAKQQQQQHHVDDTEGCEKSTAIDPQLTMALVDESTFRLLQSFNSKEVQIRPRKKCGGCICLCSWTVVAVGLLSVILLSIFAATVCKDIGVEIKDDKDNIYKRVGQMFKVIYIVIYVSMLLLLSIATLCVRNFWTQSSHSYIRRVRSLVDNHIEKSRQFNGVAEESSLSVHTAQRGGGTDWFSFILPGGGLPFLRFHYRKVWRAAYNERSRLVTPDDILAAKLLQAEHEARLDPRPLETEEIETETCAGWFQLNVMHIVDDEGRSRLRMRKRVLGEALAIISFILLPIAILINHESVLESVLRSLVPDYDGYSGPKEYDGMKAPLFPVTLICFPTLAVLTFVYLLVHEWSAMGKLHRKQRSLLQDHHNIETLANFAEQFSLDDSEAHEPAAEALLQARGRTLTPEPKNFGVVTQLQAVEGKIEKINNAWARAEEAREQAAAQASGQAGPKKLMQMLSVFFNCWQKSCHPNRAKAVAVAGFAVLMPLLGALFPAIGYVQTIKVFLDERNVRAFYLGVLMIFPILTIFALVLGRAFQTQDRFLRGVEDHEDVLGQITLAPPLAQVLRSLNVQFTAVEVEDDEAFGAENGDARGSFGMRERPARTHGNQLTLNPSRNIRLGQLCEHDQSRVVALVPRVNTSVVSVHRSWADLHREIDRTIAAAAIKRMQSDAKNFFHYDLEPDPEKDPDGVIARKEDELLKGYKGLVPLFYTSDPKGAKNRYTFSDLRSEPTVGAMALDAVDVHLQRERLLLLLSFSMNSLQIRNNAMGKLLCYTAAVAATMLLSRALLPFLELFDFGLTAFSGFFKITTDNATFILNIVLVYLPAAFLCIAGYRLIRDVFPIKYMRILNVIAMYVVVFGLLPLFLVNLPRFDEDGARLFRYKSQPRSKNKADAADATQDDKDWDRVIETELQNFEYVVVALLAACPVSVAVTLTSLVYSDAHQGWCRLCGWIKPRSGPVQKFASLIFTATVWAGALLPAINVLFGAVLHIDLQAPTKNTEYFATVFVMYMLVAIPIEIIMDFIRYMAGYVSGDLLNLRDPELMNARRLFAMQGPQPRAAYSATVLRLAQATPPIEQSAVLLGIIAYLGLLVWLFLTSGAMPLHILFFAGFNEAELKEAVKADATNMSSGSLSVVLICLYRGGLGFRRLINRIRYKNKPLVPRAPDT